MFQDMNKIVFGSAMMFMFMVLVLSKFGWIELRVSEGKVWQFNLFILQLSSFAFRFYCVAWV